MWGDTVTFRSTLITRAEGTPTSITSAHYPSSICLPLLLANSTALAVNAMLWGWRNDPYAPLCPNLKANVAQAHSGLPRLPVPGLEYWKNLSQQHATLVQCKNLPFSAYTGQLFKLSDSCRRSKDRLVRGLNVHTLGLTSDFHVFQP